MVALCLPFAMSEIMYALCMHIFVSLYIDVNIIKILLFIRIHRRYNHIAQLLLL